jgi:Carboxypeptidase regulatory-like domain/Right handed beta helix region
MGSINIIYRNLPFLTKYIQKILTISVVAIPIDPFKALGGIQIAGGSERIKVWDNQIHGGAGNGIALGSSLEAFLATLEGGLEEVEHFITDQGSLVGDVMREGTGLANITLVFEGNGISYSTTTLANGYFATQHLPAGKYKVAIASPGYKIERISPVLFQELNVYQIDVVPVAIDLGDLLAFIYEIQIDRNDISHMGLSGIGLPQIALPNRDKLPKTEIARQVLLFAQWLAVWGNPIIGLEIRENHIVNCFQNPLDDNLRATLQTRGLGGISLGLCANLAIDRNRIETNGTSHLIPVCGIFVTYGEQIEIAHNWLANNGLFSNTKDSFAGKRGGIVLTASSFPALAQLSAASTAVTSIVGVTDTTPQLLGRPAARVHDNIVNQPAGQALTLLALGPVSVVNNYLNSELSGIEKLELLVGAVFILNLGGLNRVGNPGISGAIASIGALTGTTSFTTAASYFARSPNADLRLPNGNVLFNNNQTRLGSQNTSVVSQLIFSADDIGFDGNQSDDLGGIRFSEKVKTTLAINTLLWAATLRANDTRFKEVLEPEELGSVRISLLTLSMLVNNTTNNQGDHCIFAFNADPSRVLVTTGNQVLDATLCPRLFPSAGG